MSRQIWDRRVGLKFQEPEEAVERVEAVSDVLVFPLSRVNSHPSQFSHSLDASNVPDIADAARASQHLQFDWVD